MNEQSISKWNKAGRVIYFILISIFLLSIVIQFLFAGLAVFVSPINWMKHTMFIHLFGFNIPLFLMLFAYIGRFPRWAYWHIFGLLLGVFAMYFTANMTSNISWIGALHPVIAILLFLISYQAWKNTSLYIFNKKKGVNE